MSPKCASLCLAALLAIPAIGQAPVNDEPAGALQIFDGINPAPPTGVSGLTFSNVGATTSVGYTTTCGSSANSDVFFLYQANVSGQHVFQMCTPPGFQEALNMADTIINVYDSAVPLTSIACDDDGCNSLGSATGASSFQSHCTANLTAGLSYYVRCSAWSGAVQGTFYLTALPPQTMGDTCATAVALNVGPNWASTAGMTASGSPVPAIPCTTFTATTIDNWFTYTATQNSIIDIWKEGTTQSTPALTSGTYLAVYTTPDCVNFTQVTPATNNCINNATVETFWTATAGTTYYIRTGYTAASTLAYTLFLREIVLPNDDCAGALPLSLGLNGPLNNSGATTSTGTPTCMTATTAYNDVWYSFAAPISGTLKISSCGSGYNPYLAVYDACGGNQIACDNDDLNNLGPCAAAQTLAPYVEFNTVAGTTYYVRLGSTSLFTATAGMVTVMLNLEYKFSLSMTYSNVTFDFTLTDVAGNPGEIVLNALTLNQGAYPNGWWYGVDIGITELATEIFSGPPFFTVLDGSGGYTTTIPGVPPLGITLYGVAVDFTVTGVFAKKSNPVSVTLL